MTHPLDKSRHPLCRSACAPNCRCTVCQGYDEERFRGADVVPAVAYELGRHDERKSIQESVHETYVHALSASLPHLELLRERIFGTDSQASSERANLDEQIAFVRRVLLHDGPKIFKGQS